MSDRHEDPLGWESDRRRASNVTSYELSDDPSDNPSDNPSNNPGALLDELIVRHLRVGDLGLRRETRDVLSELGIGADEELDVSPGAFDRAVTDPPKG